MTVMVRHFRLFTLILLINTSLGFAQKESISYDAHGKTESLNNENPFKRFFGEWTLKNDDWSQNWGSGTEHIKIPKHHTVSTGINTKNSLISIIDGPEPNGQIYWSYNPVTKEVDHLSSFGSIRAGKGKGTIDKQGNLKLKLTFEGEPKGTYRIYTYTWVNENEYELKSIQHNANDQPTGLFYGGTFVRVEKHSYEETVRKEILNHGAMVREAFSKGDIQKIKVLHHPEVKKALSYTNVKNGREEVIQGLKETLENYSLEFIKNEVEHIFVQDNIAIEQTVFTIKGTPKKGGKPFLFSGRTMVTYVRYDKSPTGWAGIREVIQPSNN